MNNKPYIVLVGVDFSELGDRALQEGFAVASLQDNSEVHVLSIFPVPSMDPREAIAVYAAVDERGTLEAATERLRIHVQAQLDNFAATRPGKSVPSRVISHVSVDTASHGIVQLAMDLGANLIVVGTHNRKGIERFLLGSVAESTVRYARCPVLVIPAELPPEAESVKFAPACPDCVRARQSSAGQELWCEQHRVRHGRRHTYHQADRSGGETNFPLVTK